MLTQAHITRSKEEALEQLRAHQQALGPHPSMQQFAELASQHSYVLYMQTI